MPGIRRSMMITLGRRRPRERDCRLAVGSFADDANLRRAQQRETKPFVYHLVVVHDENGDLVGHGGILRVRLDGRRRVRCETR